MERLNWEREWLDTFKEVKERIMRQKQFSELVENMKFDVLHQKHLEMKWNNKYNVP